MKLSIKWRIIFSFICILSALSAEASTEDTLAKTVFKVLQPCGAIPFPETCIGSGGFQLDGVNSSLDGQPVVMPVLTLKMNWTGLMTLPSPLVEATWLGWNNIGTTSWKIERSAPQINVYPLFTTFLPIGKLYSVAIPIPLECKMPIPRVFALQESSNGTVYSKQSGNVFPTMLLPVTDDWNRGLITFQSLCGYKPSVQQTIIPVTLRLVRKRVEENPLEIKVSASLYFDLPMGKATLFGISPDKFQIVRFGGPTYAIPKDLFFDSFDLSQPLRMENIDSIQIYDSGNVLLSWGVRQSGGDFGPVMPMWPVN